MYLSLLNLPSYDFGLPFVNFDRICKFENKVVPHLKAFGLRR